MSKPLRRPPVGARHRDERPLAWSSAGLSGLLHGALLLLALLAEPVTVSSPQGTAAGGRVEVVMIGETPEASPALNVRPAPTRAPREPERPLPDPSPPSPRSLQVQPTPVARADEPLEQRESRPAAASPPPAQPTGRRAHVWGQPPGMLPQDHAPVNAGAAPSPAMDSGRRYDASSSEPNLEVGGFQILYDVSAESRLRSWRDQGMTEVFFPLPGTREYMVCPLETALRRESGPCRLVDPDDPQMAAIGDAREAIRVQRVYRRGELVWRGPRAYR